MIRLVLHRGPTYKELPHSCDTRRQVLTSSVRAFSCGEQHVGQSVCISLRTHRNAGGAGIVGGDALLLLHDSIGKEAEAPRQRHRAKASRSSGQLWFEISQWGSTRHQDERSQAAERAQNRTWWISKLSAKKEGGGAASVRLSERASVKAERGDRTLGGEGNAVGEHAWGHSQTAQAGCSPASRPTQTAR